MATCEVCGNEYDKAFTIEAEGYDTPSIASSAQFSYLHPFADNAIVASLGTESKLASSSSVALTVPDWLPQRMSEIGPPPEA